MGRLCQSAGDGASRQLVARREVRLSTRRTEFVVRIYQDPRLPREVERTVSSQPGALYEFGDAAEEMSLAA